jgi:hypothetical protein
MIYIFLGILFVVILVLAIIYDIDPPDQNYFID